MTDPRLLKRWKIIESLLEGARLSLPVPSTENKVEYDHLLSQYKEFIDHNELGLALDYMELLGQLVPCSRAFWRSLLRAAQLMELKEKFPVLKAQVWKK